MFQTKAVEKIKIQLCVQQPFFPPENLDLCEITWKNIVERGNPKMTI